MKQLKQIIVFAFVILFLLWPLFSKTPSQLLATEEDNNATEVIEAEPSNGITQTQRTDATSTRNVGRKVDDVFVSSAIVSNMTDGIAPFDSDNAAGNDQNGTNQIVRSFDTIDYGLLVALGSKDAAYYNNIVIKITGEVKNGVNAAGTAANANFAPSFGGKVDLATKKSTFEYIVSKDSSGNPFNSNSMASIPLTLMVQGAKHDTKLTVDFKVEVIEVAGQSIKNEGIAFSSKEVKVSSKVNLKVYYGLGWNNKEFDYDAFSKTTGNKADIFSTGIALGINQLPGRSNMKGTAFPEGKISVKVTPKVQGYVNGVATSFKYGPTSNATTLLPMKVLAYGSNGYEMENQIHGLTDYQKNTFVRSAVPYSRVKPKPSTLEHDGVFDSGKVKIINNADHTFTVEFSDYKIDGYTFPEWHATNSNVKFYNLDKERLFASWSMNVYQDYKIFDYYADKIVDMNYTLNSSEITYHENGNPVTQVDNASSGKWVKYRYPPGTIYARTLFTDTSNISLSSSPIPYNTTGDASAYAGSKVRLRTWVSKSINIKGMELITKWNPNVVEYDTSDSVRFLSGWYDDYNNVLFPTLNYGVSKNGDTSAIAIRDNRKSHYDWYSTPAQAKASGKPISAVIALNSSSQVITSKVNQGLAIPLKVIGNAGAVDPLGNPNIAVTGVTGDLGGRQVDSPFDVKNYTPFTPTEYNNDFTVKKIQVPTSLQGDTLMIMPFATSISKKADKVSYTAGDEVNWTLTPNISLDSKNTVKRTVVVEDILPKGTNYLVGSSKYDNKLFNPKSTLKNSDGTTTVHWEIENIIKSNDLKTIQFKTSFNVADLTFVSSIANLKNKVVISSDGDVSPVDRRTAYADIKVTKVNQMGVDKKVNKQLIESDGVSNPLVYTLGTYNQMGTAVTNIKGLDILPATGYLDTKLTGSYQLVNLSSADSAVKLYYTTKVIPPSTDPNSIVPTVANGWTQVVGGTVAANAKAIFYHIPTIADGKTIEVTVSLKLTGNKPGDVINNLVYLNSDLKMAITSPLQTTYVVNRKIEGTAWYDRNYDGLISDGEINYPNLPVYLYKMTGTTATKVTTNLTGKSLIDANGKSLIKTDANGAYLFEALPAGSYKVGFGIKEEVAAKSLYITAPKQGSLITVNSKASLTEVKDQSHLSVDTYELPALSGISTPEFSQKYINIGVFKEAKLGLTKGVYNKKESTTRENLKDKDVKVGDNLYYELKLTNTVKESLLQKISLKDSLPAGVKFVPGTLSKTNHKGVETNLANSYFTGQELTIADLDDLLGDQEYVVVGFQVKVEKVASGKLTNVAKATGNVLKDKTVTQEARVATTVPPLPVLLKTTNKTEISVGQTYEYRLTLKNQQGGGKWLNATVTDSLPAELVYVKDSTKLAGVKVADNTAWSGNNLSLVVGDLESEGEKVVSFNVRLVKVPTNWQVVNLAKASGKDGDNKLYSPPDAKVETPVTTNILHLRQVVLNNDNSALVIPKTAYYRLENKPSLTSPTGTVNFATISETSTSHQESQITKALFTSRLFELDKNLASLAVTVRVPEYYEYVGHIQSTDGTKVPPEHDSKHLVKTAPFLDYSVKKEYWVTVFIQPEFGEKEENPRPYSWDTKLNQFGKLIN